MHFTDIAHGWAITSAGGGGKGDSGEEKVSDDVSPESEETASLILAFVPNETAIGQETGRDILTEQFYLFQNYPNPFNPVTTISYQLSALSMVELVVYNIHGQVITTLVKQKQNAGKYEILFDAGNLPSGAYLYRLKAGNKVFTGKMLLIK